MRLSLRNINLNQVIAFVLLIGGLTGALISLISLYHYYDSTTQQLTIDNVYKIGYQQTQNACKQVELKYEVDCGKLSLHQAHLDNDYSDWSISFRDVSVNKELIVEWTTDITTNNNVTKTKVEVQHCQTVDNFDCIL